MLFPTLTMPSNFTILTTAASLATSVILIRSVAADLIPSQIQDYFSSSFRNFFNRLSSQLTIIIEEFDGLTLNQMFDAANVYVGAKGTILAPRTIKVSKLDKDEELSVTLYKNQEIIDLFRGINLTWVLHTSSIRNISESKSNNKSTRTEIRFFDLSFHKKNRDVVLKDYLPHVLERAKEIKEERKAVRLHTVDYNGTDYWSSVALKHPASFDTMIMEQEKKKMLMEDLDQFLKRKDYYRKVGKAWKRGYLLYGPPGTGKSSLVAAMANYLKFDVYDLDLREVQCNSDLRRLLIGTGNKSILVIEDIDCNVGLPNRETGERTMNGDDDKITLSGLLNFIDGLWTSCGDERIVVFTTNHKERLDPALLRPGRMDIHIEMSYCKYGGFKTMASNYIGKEDHQLFGVIERLMKEVQATPAEIAGELMKTDKPGLALEGVIKFLENKKQQQNIISS
ncbi:AAA-ATPase At3g50940-like [Impatiens glandulifera]|uniref:AAA-ATPase At3g50940-like n=1 Tax=Impatiens glandulifera TaxID=253017 RepID=UPI001FB077B2|nr:AAA-ATPase At3g50940-like [Impatiens glandulifera]